MGGLQQTATKAITFFAFIVQIVLFLLFMLYSYSLWISMQEGLIFSNALAFATAITLVASILLWRYSFSMDTEAGIPITEETFQNAYIRELSFVLLLILIILAGVSSVYTGGNSGLEQYNTTISVAVVLLSLKSLYRIATKGRKN